MIPLALTLEAGERPLHDRIGANLPPIVADHVAGDDSVVAHREIGVEFGRIIHPPDSGRTAPLCRPRPHSAPESCGRSPPRPSPATDGRGGADATSHACRLFGPGPAPLASGPDGRQPIVQISKKVA